MSIETGEVEVVAARQKAETRPRATQPSADRLRPSKTALTALHLEKTYGRRRVVDNVSLHVEKGQVVGTGSREVCETLLYMIDAGMSPTTDQNQTKTRSNVRAAITI